MIPSQFWTLGKSRSSIDLVTNFTHFNSVDLETELTSFLEYGKTPDHLFPEIVHEITHHWCFLSPVGSALSYLQLRARKNGLLLLDNDSEDDNKLRQIVDDTIRYETAIILLRPLIEGLALFSEFDAISGQYSRAFSMPTEIVGWLFSNGLEGIKYGNIFFPNEGTRQPFIKWRNSDQGLARKIAIFGYPFSVKNGGYLPGYLTVRNLWFNLANHDVRLEVESDLVMMFIRTFFFEDYELVALLLDDNPVDLLTVDRITTHIMDRFDQLLRISKEKIKKFEVSIDNEEYAKNIIELLDEIIVNDKELAEKGHQRFQRLQHELEKKLNAPSLSNYEEEIENFNLMVISNREIIHFGYLEVLVNIDEIGSCEAFYKDKAVFQGTSLPRVNPGSSNGSIELVCSSTSDIKVRAIIVYRDEEPVSILCGVPDEISKEYLDRFLNLYDPINIQHITETMNKCSEEILSKSCYYHIIEKQRTYAEDMTRILYSRFAFPALDYEKRNKLNDEMKDVGLFKILNEDRSLMAGIALISLTWSMQYTRPQITHLLKNHNIELELILKEVNKCTKKYGIPEIWENGEWLISSI